ncbi:MAG: Cof-type HAD-IIB family hydrolase [Planctomycetota bacterium]
MDDDPFAELGDLAPAAPTEDHEPAADTGVSAAEVDLDDLFTDPMAQVEKMRAEKAAEQAARGPSIFDIGVQTILAERQAKEKARDQAERDELTGHAQAVMTAEYWPDDQDFGKIVEVVETQPKRAPRAARPTGPPRFDLLAIDLDGTLLRSDKRLSSFDVRTIREASRRGVKVVVATARPPRSSRYIHELLRLDTLMVNYNGALIHDRLNNHHVQHNPLPRHIAKRIIDRARAIDPRVVVSIEVLDKWYTDHDDPNHRNETAKKFKPDFVGPLDVPLQHDLTKLMFLTHTPQLNAITDALRDQFNDKAVFLRSDDHCLQVASPKVDKGEAVAWVARLYGIPAEKCMTLGDAPNDIGMIRWAGHGCAMGNAFPEVREVADAVVESNDQEGVGQAIEDYVL